MSLHKCVFISYGMGGGAVEWWQNGLRLLVQRCKAAGYSTMRSPYNWSDVNTIAAEISALAPDVKVAVGGASLGSNEAPDVARRTKHRIDYLFGFQTSLWGARVDVPSNVEAADNIYNPGLLGWLRTFGMGSGVWKRAPGNHVTVLRNIPLYESHPADWGTAQDIIFSQIHRALG